MSLAQGGQILMTRSVFDNARQSLKGGEIAGIEGLSWLNHGLYRLKGLDEPVEICEVRAGDAGPVTAPASSEKASGWRGGRIGVGLASGGGANRAEHQVVLEKKLARVGLGRCGWGGIRR